MNPEFPENGGQGNQPKCPGNITLNPGIFCDASVAQTNLYENLKEDTVINFIVNISLGVL